MMEPIQPLVIAVEDLVSREYQFSSDRTFTITAEELYRCLPESFVEPMSPELIALPARRHQACIPAGLSALAASQSSASEEDDGARLHSSDPQYDDDNSRHPSSDNMSGDKRDMAGDREVIAAGRAMYEALPEGGESSSGTGVVRAAARATRRSRPVE
jgi:hypothetical protein